jgi:hypothetical protein
MSNGSLSKTGAHHALSDSRRTGKSYLSPEQEGMINFDEFLVIWYCLLALWYGYFAFSNWRRRNNAGASSILYPEYAFAAVHWFIFSIAIMGLANFLFSFGLLEVLDHRPSIGRGVKRLSYASKYGIY